MKKGLLSGDYLTLVWLVFLPVIFILVVKFMVTYSTHSICIFKFLTGKDCWGCGMTRAFYELFNFHFQKAYEYNPKIIIVAPLMFIGWLQTIITTVKNRKKHTLCDVADR